MGVVSELSAFFTVKPGHEEALRMAVQRFKGTRSPVIGVCSKAWPA